MYRSEQDREAVLVALTSQESFGRAAAAAMLGAPSAPHHAIGVGGVGGAPSAPHHTPGVVGGVGGGPTGGALLEARGLLMEAEGGWLRR